MGVLRDTILLINYIAGACFLYYSELFQGIFRSRSLPHYVFAAIGVTPDCGRMAALLGAQNIGKRMPELPP